VLLHGSSRNRLHHGHSGAIWRKRAIVARNGLRHGSSRNRLHHGRTRAIVARNELLRGSSRNRLHHGHSGAIWLDQPLGDRNVLPLGSTRTIGRGRPIEGHRLPLGRSRAIGRRHGQKRGRTSTTTENGPSRRWLRRPSITAHTCL
jgi:hypothetical protein